MGLPVEVNNLMLGSLGGYTVGRSLRFRSSASAYLNRTQTAGSQTTWTWSGWVKRGKFTTAQYLMQAGGSSGSGVTMSVIADDFQIETGNGTTQYYARTTAQYRDPSAWYHVVMVCNTTSATSTLTGTPSDRLQIWINGVQVTSFSASSIPTQNFAGYMNQNTVAANIGRWNGASPSYYYDGYLAEVNFIDGQALTPSSFGAYDTNGVWQPKKYSGTYGTNGFYLNFSDNSNGSNVVADKSGNGNNWTPNNISVATGGPTSVASATGALPIYETTDTYGAVKGSGVRSDSNASSVVLDVPMGTSSGLDISDQSPSGRTSSTKTLTNNNGIVVSTSVSKFYGGSADLTINNRYFSLAHSTDFDMGTGNFTLETWIYPTGGECRLMCGQNPTGETAVIPNSGIYIGISGVGGQVLGGTISTNKWQHVAFVRDGATIRGFVDGVPCPSVYSIGAGTSFSFTTGTGSLIGRVHLSAGTPVYCPAYLQDFRVYKGVAKYSGSFNPPSSVANSTSAITNDSMIDSPTNSASSSNYAVMNPLDSLSGTASNGNLLWTAGAAQSDIRGTIAIPSSGKFYMECTVGSTTNASSAASFGLATSTVALNSPNAVSGLYQLYASSSGYLSLNGTNVSSSLGVWTAGDILQIAVDVDNTKMWLGKNNTWYDSSGGSTGNPSTGANATSTTSMVGLFPFSNCYSNNVTWNMGQRPFSYTPPTGYSALNTYNLPTPTIKNGAQYMAATTYTGNGTAGRVITVPNINEVGFAWVKSRSGIDDHRLANIVTGGNKHLKSNTTDAESTGTNIIQAFSSNTFTVGNDTSVNANGSTYVGWTWAANGTGVTNTSGTITSTVSASPSSGFSIATYTGTGANATVGHGLGVAPSMIIFKRRDNTGNWAVYHTSVGNTAALYMNLTAAQSVNSVFFNNTSPTSSVFSIGTGTDLNVSGSTNVAYCFSAVSGYSAFGKYTGNGSSDGPFIYTGFRPRFVLFKNASASATPWIIFDTTRNTYNEANLSLQPEVSDAEKTNNGWNIDILSNGFKVRNTSSSVNGSGNTITFAAFAEVPYNFARAR